jgi:hypothetical protein
VQSAAFLVDVIDESADMIAKDSRLGVVSSYSEDKDAKSLLKVLLFHPALRFLAGVEPKFLETEWRMMEVLCFVLSVAFT